MAKISLKNLLAVSAGLIIVAPTTVDVLANVNSPVNNQISTQQIVDEINQVRTYEIIIFIKTGVTVESLKKEITSDFIQDQLEGAIKTAFKPSFFHFKNFTYNARSLENSDLEGFGIIDAEIQYDYGSFKNQTTKFTINKTMAAEDINQAIQRQEYQKSIESNEKNSVATFKKEINGNFIKNQIEENASQAIVPELFSINTITYNGKKLEDNDLRKVQKIVTVVNYNYDDYDGEFQLIINIKSN